MKISVQELLIVLAIVIIIFGPKQIPKLVKMFKKSANSMKEGLADDEEDIAPEKKKKSGSTKKAKVEESAADDDEE